ncbi:glycosyltransferase [Pusillimonas sp. TS35]|jgi:glycosyltransferase involved in cell wall biosynthesis|uniref:glycosyltransferase family 4 protein n=1 Tax=Paracandidimonas lactea TaxID=2895524 RepID=UPI0013680DFB|nr:glycosyltransferase family 4 protein [Paracandidimonas lactea]MYN11824.1 glycosyltransferase [Pusillimonas sp. TS35]
MKQTSTFLLLASFADSIVRFRGPLIDALIDRGMDVHVAAPDLNPAHPVRQALEAKGVTVHDITLQRTGMNPGADLRSLWQILRLMRRIRPGYVLSYTIKPVIYGTLAAWLARVPRRCALITGLGYAFQHDDEGDDRRARLLRLVRGLYAAALARAHLVFFQNPDDQDLFCRLGILPDTVPSQIVNGSGVDVREYTPAPLPDAPCFLMIGRLLGDKGVREYAEAARMIRTTQPDARFALVGWIDENPDAIGQHELDNWIQTGVIDYLGRLDDVRPAIADSTVYVLPSYREGTPRTVLEAMAMSRAIITTDAPGCRETVTEGDNGYLVSVKSAAELAQAMQRFLDDPTLAARMGARSLSIAREKYDVRKVNTAMLTAMQVPAAPAPRRPHARARNLNATHDHA